MTAAVPSLEVPPVFSYGLFDSEDALNSPVAVRSPTAGSDQAFPRRQGGRDINDLHVGLAYGPGGQIARSCLVNTGATMMEQNRARKHQAFDIEGFNQNQAHAQSAHTRSEVLPWRDNLMPTSTDAKAPPRKNEAEPQGLLMGLLLNDSSPADKLVLTDIKKHRWTFKGAQELAQQSRGFCFFVWCLLELQRNVQTDDEGDALDPELVKACRTFVGAQCRQGRMGDMYQVLTHFICNSVVFHEWDKFLRKAFENERSREESFMVPHLEQVWGRFQRLSGILESIFGALDERFVWKHRLPKVSELVHEHMRRRCFSSELVARNELFQQASIKDETLKQVKFAFGLA